MAKVIYFHMNQLGDLLFSLPVLKAFKTERAGSIEFFSYVKPEYAPLLKATGLIDGVIEKPKSIIGKAGVIYSLKKQAFTQAVLFSESPESVALSFLSGIPRRTGFKTSALAILMTETAKRTGVPSLKNNKELGIICGLRNIPENYAGLLNIPNDVNEQAKNWIFEKGCDGRNVVIISAGASKRRKEKCWPATHWIDVLEFLQKRNCFPVIIGTKAEKTEMEYLADSVRPKPVIYDGSEGVMMLAGLMKNAKFFIGIDSGAMHLAAAVKLPVIGLFGPTDPEQIGPQPLNAHTVIKKKTIEEITQDLVFDAAEKLLW